MCLAQVLNGDFACPSGRQQGFVTLIESMLKLSSASRPSIDAVLRQLQHLTPSQSRGQPGNDSKPAGMGQVPREEKEGGRCTGWSSMWLLRYVSTGLMQTTAPHAGATAPQPPQAACAPNGAWDMGGWDLNAWDTSAAQASSQPPGSFPQVWPHLKGCCLLPNFQETWLL